ncbi:hypothetical protein ABT284_23815, partial [Nocardioides sp. NPDC000441]
MTPEELRGRVEEFLAEHPVATTEPSAFLHARYQAGLAWVAFPEGHGGLGASRALQPLVSDLFEAGARGAYARHRPGQRRGALGDG